MKATKLDTGIQFCYLPFLEESTSILAHIEGVGNDWGYSVMLTVHLSVASALTNTLLCYALAQSIVVSS
jgi:hypothetical protein